MSNAWENVSMLAAESLSVLQDSLVIAGLCSTDKTSDFMIKPNGYAVGSTVNIKTRPAYEAKEFTSAIDIQSIRSSVRPMTIEKHFDVSVEIGAKEKVLNMDGFSEEVIVPAVTALAEKVDAYIGTKIVNGAGLYASSTLLESAADVALARKAAIVQQLQLNGRFALLDLDLEAIVLGQSWFNQSQTRGAAGVASLQEGQMGRVMGIDWNSSINFPTMTHTAGTGTATTVNSSGNLNLVGSSQLDVAATTGQFEAGDHIQVAGVRRPLVVLAQTAAGEVVIPIVNPLTEIIPNGAAVTVIGAGEAQTYHGAIFDKPALGVAMPLLDPASDKPSASMSYEGVSIRVVQGYDMTSKKETMSLDLLVGAEAYDHRRITLLSDF